MYCKQPFWCFLIIVFCFHNSVAAQVRVLPDDLVIDERLNYDKYTSYVIPVVNWLQQTPIDSYRTERRRLDNFLMAWLQKNEVVIVTMPEYLVRFQSANNELYFLYAGGWIKYALATKDKNRKNCYVAGIKSMLDFYNNNKSIKRTDYIDNIAAIYKQGKLLNLFDSSAATNTQLYLRKPYDKTSFKPDENYFHFSYTAANFIDPKSVLYRYKLEGYYDKWIVTNEESVTFPNLPSGKYRFVIQAGTTPDFSTHSQQEYSFSVATPFYKQLWFILLVIAATGMLVYFIIRQRELSLKRLSQLQQERIIFEYEHLRSQVNPHFLFNSLNTLTNLIEEDPVSAAGYSERLSDLYRNMQAHSSQNLVLLKEELEILDNYIHIQKSRFGDALNVHIAIADGILQNHKIIPLALQMLVENAIKHNVVSKTQPLHIDISSNAHELIISNTIQSKHSRDKSSGLGLVNISKRYALSTKKQVVYGIMDNKFVVRLPLL